MLFSRTKKLGENKNINLFSPFFYKKNQSIVDGVEEDFFLQQKKF